MNCHSLSLSLSAFRHHFLSFRVKVCVLQTLIQIQGPKLKSFVDPKYNAQNPILLSLKIQGPK